MYKLVPVFKDYLWGGTKLKEFYHVNDIDKIAESWVLSVHKDGENIIDELGIPLSNYLDDHSIWGEDNQEMSHFPVMVKLIDAKQDLSIQVHPNDEDSFLLEGENGKTEMWYILDSDPDAFIYFGFNRDVSLDELRLSIQNNTILSLLNKVPVKKGDVYFVESGTIHAIGSGCLLAEIQQTSNVTYRIYDYDRVDKFGNKRKLDVDKALKVINTSKLEIDERNGRNESLVKKCKYFTVHHYVIDKEGSIAINKKSFCHILVIKGQGMIDGKMCKFTDSLFLKAEDRIINIQGNLELLVTQRED